MPSVWSWAAVAIPADPSSDRCVDQLAVDECRVAALSEASCRDSSDGAAEETGDIIILSKQYRHYDCCVYILLTIVAYLLWCVFTLMYVG